MSEHPLVVLSTAPDAEVAAQIAARLLEDRLAACVNIVPGIRSMYRWDGQLCDDSEVLLICKTDGSRLDELTTTLRRVHPYDCPEVVALPVVGGSSDYLSWISAMVTPG